MRNSYKHSFAPVYRLVTFVETEPELVEDAVRYVIFLVDADKLFDTALGMYDFSLVLMIAQHAQKVYSFISVVRTNS